MAIIEFSYCIFYLYRFQIVILIVLLHILTILLAAPQFITINMRFCRSIDPSWRSPLDTAVHSVLMRQVM